MTTTAAVPLTHLAQRIARQQSELEALRKEYDARETHLADLKHRKEELEGQLRKLDAEIQAVNQGKTPPPPPAPTKTSPAKAATAAPPTPAAAPPTKAPRPNTLPALLVQLVRKAKGPLTMKQLADEVVRRKFPTSSHNVPRLVQTRIRGLMAKGIFQRANGQPGVVLAGPESAAKAPAAGIPPDKGVNNKKSVSSRKVGREGPNGRPKKSLRVILTELLAKTRQPLLARELAEQAKAQGYQTDSKDFVRVIWVMLGKMDNVENVAGKGYRLKKR